MTSVTKLLIGAFALVATMAFAETESTDPTVIARQALMKTIGMNTKILGDMAGGKADRFGDSDGLIKGLS